MLQQSNRSAVLGFVPRFRLVLLVSFSLVLRTWDGSTLGCSALGTWLGELSTSTSSVHLVDSFFRRSCDDTSTCTSFVVTSVAFHVARAFGCTLSCVLGLDVLGRGLLRASTTTAAFVSWLDTSCAPLLPFPSTNRSYNASNNARVCFACCGVVDVAMVLHKQQSMESKGPMAFRLGCVSSRNTTTTPRPGGKPITWEEDMGGGSARARAGVDVGTNHGRDAKVKEQHGETEARRNNSASYANETRTTRVRCKRHGVDENHPMRVQESKTGPIV